MTMIIGANKTNGWAFLPFLCVKCGVGTNNDTHTRARAHTRTHTYIQARAQ